MYKYIIDIRVIIVCCFFGCSGCYALFVAPSHYHRALPEYAVPAPRVSLPLPTIVKGDTLRLALEKIRYYSSNREVSDPIVSYGFLSVHHTHDLYHIYLEISTSISQGTPIDTIILASRYWEWYIPSTRRTTLHNIPLLVRSTQPFHSSMTAVRNVLIADREKKILSKQQHHSLHSTITQAFADEIAGANWDEIIIETKDGHITAKVPYNHRLLINKYLSEAL